MNIFYPIELLANTITEKIFQINLETHLGEIVSYFINDVIKIFLLIAVIIFIVSYIRTFFPPEKTKKFLSNHKFPLVNNLLAALVGIATPFCSCSAVPLFIGFVEAGVPLGATFSFLIASPMINEVAVVLLWGLFGWRITLIYVFSGLVIATFAGFILGKMKLEKYVEGFVYNLVVPEKKEIKVTTKDRVIYAKEYVKDVITTIWPYILIGVGVGAFIHGYAPAELIGKIAGPENPFSVIIATLIGIPLYSNAAGTLPIVSALVEKGVQIGTALAFMMAVTALSFPEFIILRKVLKPKLIFIYASIIGLGIIFTGYLFNVIL